MKKARVAKRARKIVKRLLFIVEVIIMVVFIADMFKHYERYDSVARYRLMLDLEKGNKEAEEYYQDNYIKDDLYLFDGDISFNMFAEKYNISNKDAVYQDYKDSGLSLNEYVKEYKEGL